MLSDDFERDDRESNDPKPDDRQPDGFIRYRTSATWRLLRQAGRLVSRTAGLRKGGPRG